MFSLFLASARFSASAWRCFSSLAFLACSSAMSASRCAACGGGGGLALVGCGGGGAGASAGCWGGGASAGGAAN
ncbi:hypothetical protein [Ideonella paludis]|uniref:hypothetical protein n=1 Tax=Ideonella paludis TaxID=1233411 RepID=UPI0036404F88